MDPVQVIPALFPNLLQFLLHVRDLHLEPAVKLASPSGGNAGGAGVGFKDAAVLRRERMKYKSADQDLASKNHAKRHSLLHAL